MTQKSVEKMRLSAVSGKEERVSDRKEDMFHYPLETPISEIYRKIDEKVQSTEPHTPLF